MAKVAGYKKKEIAVRKQIFKVKVYCVTNSMQTYVHFVGPIAAGLSNALGCRVVAILGSVLAAAGLALSASASTISQLYFTAGCMTGIGFGFIYLPAACTISFYFEKKRAFATGIAVCGSGMGGFILGKQLLDSFFVEIRRSFRAN